MTQNTTRSATLPPPEERRRLREAKPLTEKQIATAVGVTRSTIRSWETGRTNPRGRKRESYAKLLAGIELELLERAALARRTERAAVKAAQERTAARLLNTHGAPLQDHPEQHPDQHPGSHPEPRAEPAAEPAARPVTAAAVLVAPADSGAEAVSASSAESVIAAEAEAEAAAAVAAAVEAAAVAEAEAAARAAEAKAAALAALAAATTPEQAFDVLYTYTGPALARQTFLLTGRRALSKESVEQAFHLAWQRWPEVAVDRDPPGWVRVAAYEYAMSPWHSMRRAHRHPDPATPGELQGPGARALHEALLALPPSYRRTLLLYDGLRLDLPETAAETEASTPATVNRLMHARAALAAHLPELADPALLHARLDALAGAVTPPSLAPPGTVRTRSERRIRLWTRAAISFTTLIVGATAFTVTTAPTQYHAPVAAGERVGGVPAAAGPQRLTRQDVKLRAHLRAQPANGPYRLLPRPE
ncbi:helix-turn-helix domain-containing protein [Streptomyces paludis]|uniref:Helix-turn-helix domain-containing protein n=1 Tax=Streptomyces paludis TaxID=2282738 RepID=A0A345HSX4_9ACTN|nr:helix-turn-helix domain-containing protein [Streptomyces paludis]AXG79798.1 helix-turn-helix domain-containing protein [Streptomyces paludis]